MTSFTGFASHHRAVLQSAADAAARAVPPAWPLTASVAVNPFLGQVGGTLADAAARLGRFGVPVAMPRSWYLDRIARGAIAEADLAGALAACPHAGKPADLSALSSAIAQPSPPPRALPTVADLVAEACGVDWPGLVAERFGAWAASHFDQGQALWSAPRDKGAWASWRAWATRDLTPEIHGLHGFAAFVADVPHDPIQAAMRATGRLGLPEAALDTYFHQLLMSLGAWAQYARHELWRAELAGGSDTTITDFLAIRLLWEEALYERHERAIASGWDIARAGHAAPVAPSGAQIVDSILQEAADRAAQRGLASDLAGPADPATDSRPALQAVFCIDVRSEVLRRALEGLDPSIRTHGFAGFFGVSTSHRPFASDVEERRMPVLLNPAVGSRGFGEEPCSLDEDRTARIAARAKRAWGRFKLAAVSSFAFVEAMGPVYAARLLRDSLSLTRMPRPHDRAPRFDPPLDLDARVGMAETILRAMSLTHGFARVVLLVGHGASVVNNPYASSLHCGACGGHSGEVNARLLASLLNATEVRRALGERGIVLPADTLFVGARHDTTTDEVTLYDGDLPSPDHAGDLARIRRWLAGAGAVARGERAARLPGAAAGGDLPARSRDWAEVRPEWALAGCQAFIAAPRSRTVGRSLGGRAFLHDYDWQQDREGGYRVLELIMTAPVVVASWISLQYFGSTVAPEVFGSGNKLLHNVVGGIGILEGNGGVLRAGLPRQSVHDGERLAHEPLRLSVCIEAPIEAMSGVLARHDEVRALFDNRWLHLLALDGEGRVAARYVGDLRWEHQEAPGAPASMRAVA